MSWQDQGRQYHMWFGSGHAPVKLKPIVEKDGSTTEQELEERLRTVVHGAISALPRKFRPQAEAQFQSGTLETLTEAMAAWIYGGKMDAASFAHHFFDRDADDPVVASLRAAVSETVEAETRPQLAAASGHLADAIKTVGVDNWPRFVADARRRAHVKATLAAIEKSRQPVMSVSARVGDAGSGGGGKGARLAQVEEPVPEETPSAGAEAPPTPPVKPLPAPGAMLETETPAEQPGPGPNPLRVPVPIAPEESPAAKPAAAEKPAPSATERASPAGATETSPYIKLPSQLEAGFDTSKPIGHFTVPSGLTPGTTLFGDYVHEEIVQLIRAAAPSIEFIANTAPGVNGVDIEVPSRYISQVGFRFAEIKPLTKSGISKFNAQVARWKLPGLVQAISYDPRGNIYNGFPTVK